MPAFLAPPQGAPVYHGFPVIDGVLVDGFRFGMITDFLTEPDTAGDAYVIAPDGSRAGLVWESEVGEAYFQEVLPPDETRWGVWAVGLPVALQTVDDVPRFLEMLIPELRPRWEAWRAR